LNLAGGKPLSVLGNSSVGRGGDLKKKNKIKSPALPGDFYFGVGGLYKVQPQKIKNILWREEDERCLKNRRSGA